MLKRFLSSVLVVVLAMCVFALAAFALEDEGTLGEGEAPNTEIPIGDASDDGGMIDEGDEAADSPGVTSDDSNADEGAGEMSNQMAAPDSETLEAQDSAVVADTVLLADEEADLAVQDEAGSDSQLVALADGEENLSWELDFTYDDSALTCAVTGYHRVGGASGNITDDLVIPSSVVKNGTTYTVTAIADNAFKAGSGGGAFYGRLVLPNTITRIGSYAFYNQWNMTGNLTLPSSLVEIGERAFWETEFSGNLVIPAGVESIPYGAFNNCDNFTGLSFAAGSQIRSIGEAAFNNNNKMETLSLPEGLVVIDKDAFNRWESLEVLTIPSSVTTIGQSAFKMCMSLKTITYNGGFFGEGLQRIGISAFEQCEQLTGNLVIPASVISIGDYAFSRCESLSSLSFAAGSHLESIGAYAFGKGQYGSFVPIAGELQLPASVTSIGDYAFAGCENLTGAVPALDGIEVGVGAFKDCEGFTSYTLPANDAVFTEVPAFLFSGCKGLQGTIVIPAGITAIGESAFAGCEQLTGALDLSNMTAIGKGAFKGCSGITSLTLPTTGSLTEIGAETFSGCSNITGDLVIPEGVEIVRDSAFYNCYGMNGTLALPSTLTEIYDYAFYNCHSLTGDLEIPAESGTMLIRKYAFYSCTGFESLSLPSTLTHLGESAFMGCRGLKGTLTIPGSVAVGDYSFYNCSGLEGLSLESGIGTIGMYAFSGCGGLSGELVIPASVNLIKVDAFEYCSGLTGLRFAEGSSLSSIGENAFYGCSRLAGELVLPSTLSSLGPYAFSDCTSLTGDVVIPASLRSLSNNVFYGCSGLTGTLTIPADLAATSTNNRFLRGTYFSTIVNESALTFDAGQISSTDHYVDAEGVTVTTIGTGTYTRVAGATPVDPDPVLVDISGATITGIAAKTYTGKAITQAPKVVVAGVTLASGTDYTLSYQNNTKVGTATVIITGAGGYTGSVSKTFKINKAANPLVVKAKTATVKAKNVKKKAQSLKVAKVLAISKAQGKLTYAKKSGNKKIVVDKKTGKVTVKKGLKKGTYKAKVAVKAAGNANYNAKTVTVTFKVKVK